MYKNLDKNGIKTTYEYKLKYAVKVKMNLLRIKLEHPTSKDEFVFFTILKNIYKKNEHDVWSVSLEFIW